MVFMRGQHTQPIVVCKLLRVVFQMLLIQKITKKCHKEMHSLLVLGFSTDLYNICILHHVQN